MEKKPKKKDTILSEATLKKPKPPLLVKEKKLSGKVLEKVVSRKKLPLKKTKNTIKNIG